MRGLVGKSVTHGPVGATGCCLPRYMRYLVDVSIRMLQRQHIGRHYVYSIHGPLVGNEVDTSCLLQCASGIW